MKAILPQTFTSRMNGLLKSEYQSFAHAYEKSGRKSLCISELKTTTKKFQAQAPFLMEPVTWLKNGFYFEYSAGASQHPYYHAGVYYITEASAMTPPDRFPIEKGDKVLDLCAAPGGKSFALLGKLKGTGLLVANEINKTRSKALLFNLEKTGSSNIIITNEQPNRLEQKFTGYFDKVLVDAPCSGEGMFRRDKTAIETWSEEKVKQLAALQKSILSSAVKMLRPGGILMYSTCTFSPEENEQNVSWLLNEFPDLQIMEIQDYEGFDHGRSEWADQDLRVEKAVRIWPHRMEAEGQFMALFQKSCNLAKEEPYSKKTKKRQTNTIWRSFSRDEKIQFDSFCRHVTIQFPKERLFTFKGMAYLIPEDCPDLSALSVVRTGLLLGEFKKDRFEPSQSLAFAFTKDNYFLTMDLKSDNERVMRYLKGETLEAEGDMPNGWILILADGFPLGFGKKSGHLIKNKLLYSRRLL